MKMDTNKHSVFLLNYHLDKERRDHFAEGV